MRLKIKNVRLTDDLFLRLRRESERTGASESEILRRAAREYLEQREKMTEKDMNHSRS